MHITGQMTLRTLLSERSQTQKDTRCTGDSSVLTGLYSQAVSSHARMCELGRKEG